jgi:hypothetical protein
MAQGVRRFQIMALLQAARAYRLGLKQDEAKSWGLNRAIFYAAARHGFKRKLAQYLTPGGEAEAEERKQIKPGEFYVLGGERGNLANPGPKGALRFQMGGQVQSPHDFDHQIKSRFGDRWKEAWSQALEVIDESDPRDLQNQQRFFNSVYKPRRDELAEKYSASAIIPSVREKKRKTASTRASHAGPIKLVTKTKKAA